MLIWGRIQFAIKIHKEFTSIRDVCIRYSNDMLHLYTLEFESPKQTRKEILEELENKYGELTQSPKNSADFSRSDLFAIYLDNFIADNALDNNQPRPALLDELDYLIKNGNVREILESTLIKRKTIAKWNFRELNHR